MSEKKTCPWGIPHPDGFECVYCERNSLREEVAALREALERIKRGETAVPLLRPELYGHAIAIATCALSRPALAGNGEEARRGE